MTAFEAYGVDYQINARSIKEAKRNFRKSCNDCATKGKYISCEKCDIANAHRDVIKFIFN